MAKATEHYICQSCGTVAAKWAGRCDDCGNWNTMVAEKIEVGPPGSLSAQKSGQTGGQARAIEFSDLKAESTSPPRLMTGINEFDRVCGGGLVIGSAMLMGGNPGIGKSTLLLQVTAALADAGHRVAYISGEEATGQIRMRAQRLNLQDKPVQLASATALRDILATLKADPPEIVVIDSIQTVWSDALPGTPGSVTQMRACSQDLIRFAKSTGTILILVGHVTKDGQIAGPRVLEHLVDAVLYFEGDREMTASGLQEVANPSALFLSARGGEASGNAIFAGIEGTRPVLVEIQALVAPSTLAAPRRAVVGWDSARLSMLLAVLDARCGLGFGRHDVFLNVAGGMRISEPAADLAAAAALCSSLFDAPLPHDQILFGEVALSGQIRPVNQIEARLNEAVKLGFATAILPPAPRGKKDKNAYPGLKGSHHLESLNGLVTWMRKRSKANPQNTEDHG